MLTCSPRKGVRPCLLTFVWENADLWPMPRRGRVEYVGAIYHVMDRGDRLEAIFRDDDDRHLFLKTLGQACERTGWRVHAYVLMGNHYHLLIETPEANL